MFKHKVNRETFSNMTELRECSTDDPLPKNMKKKKSNPLKSK